MPLLKKRKNPKDFAGADNRRKEDKGPAKRGLLGRIFLKARRFGKGHTIDPESIRVYDYGDADFKEEKMGIAARAETDKRRLRRLSEALAEKRFYYGPQYVGLNGTHLYEAFRKHLNVRKGDIIEISLSVLDTSVLPEIPVEEIWVSAKNPKGKGQVFFKMILFDDKKLFGEANSFLMDAVEKGRIKLFAKEREPFNRSYLNFKEKLKTLVNKIGTTDGNNIRVKTSDLFNTKTLPAEEEVIIPELKRLSERLIPGKRIILEEDIEY